VALTSDAHPTIGNIMDVLHERGFGILILIFAMPMALPLPVPPGINLLFAVPIIILFTQMIFHMHEPWLPVKIRSKSVDPKTLNKAVDKAKPLADAISHLIWARLAFITGKVGITIIGIIGVIFALCICIPIPLTNTVPSFAILLMAIGILLRDGLCVLAGIVIGSAWIGILATIGIAGLRALLSTFM
jgi:hypothetical protein